MATNKHGMAAKFGKTEPEKVEVPAQETGPVDAEPTVPKKRGPGRPRKGEVVVKKKKSAKHAYDLAQKGFEYEVEGKEKTRPYQWPKAKLIANIIFRDLYLAEARQSLNAKEAELQKVRNNLSEAMERNAHLAKRLTAEPSEEFKENTASGFTEPAMGPPRQEAKSTTTRGGRILNRMPATIQ